ncbi:putative tyrosine-protein phosphatase auxilin [Varanus komodoensis]|nr:putative tyrosine-protein phosphatase auxilin [Varanus komodoensis]
MLHPPHSFPPWTEEKSSGKGYGASLIASGRRLRKALSSSPERPRFLSVAKREVRLAEAAPIAGRQRGGDASREAGRPPPTASRLARPCSGGCSPSLGVWPPPPLWEGYVLPSLPLSDSSMSLLGSYRKKTNNDGYESLQLVDSNGDFCGSRERTGGGTGGGGGNSSSTSSGGGKQGVIPAVVAAASAARSPGRQLQHQPLDSSTMDSSGASSPDMESSYGGGLLDMMKGGAGRLFSNLKDNLKDTLKDTSTKVMQSVASYTKGELDISYITSRIIVMSFPGEGVELGFRNHIDDVRTFLDSRHPDHYTVFNLSPKSYRTTRFHNRGFGSARERRGAKVNDWLRVWCQKEHFMFLSFLTMDFWRGMGCTSRGRAKGPLEMLYCASSRSL